MCFYVTLTAARFICLQVGDRSGELTARLNLSDLQMVLGLSYSTNTSMMSESHLADNSLNGRCQFLECFLNRGQTKESIVCIVFQLQLSVQDSPHPCSTKKVTFAVMDPFSSSFYHVGDFHLLLDVPSHSSYHLSDTQSIGCSSVQRSMVLCVPKQQLR